VRSEGKGRGFEAAKLVATKRSLSDFGRGKARPGAPGEMAVQMLFQIGLKFLASVAVLLGIPESKIESFRGDFLRCRCRGTWRRERGRIVFWRGRRSCPPDTALYWRIGTTIGSSTKTGRSSARVRFAKHRNRWRGRRL